MKVKALTSFSLGGGRDVHPGEVFEMSDAAAKSRVQRGWVTPATDAPEAETENKKRPDPAQRGPGHEHPEAGTESVTTRDPQPSHRDPPPPADGAKGKKGKD